MPEGCTQSTHPSLEHVTETGMVPILKSSRQLEAELKCLGCERVMKVAQVGQLCSLVPFGPPFPLLGLTRYSAVSAQGSQSIKAFAGPPTDGRLLLTANSEKSRHLCCARFAPFCTQGTSHDCLIKVQGPSQLALDFEIFVFTFPCSTSSALTSLHLHQKPSRTGCSSKCSHPVGCAAASLPLPDVFWSCGSQGSSLQVFPSTEAASSEVISICKAPAGTVQVGGKEKLTPVPFAPQWAASCSVVQIAHALWGPKLKLLPKKPSNY